MKRFSLVTVIEQMPTVSSNGKATVGAGHGDCAGESAGVKERGMLRKGWMKELGKPMGVSVNE